MEVQESDEERKRQLRLRRLTEKMPDETLPLTDKTLKMLKQKHPEVMNHTPKYYFKDPHCLFTQYYIIIWMSPSF